MSEFKSLDIKTIELNGLKLIEASAGTGKTFAIANLYLRLLIEKELDPKNILVVTFTEAATEELKDRIRKIIVSAKKSLADIEKSEEQPIKDILINCAKEKAPEKIEKLLTRASINFDEAAIFTIHGFCNRVLKENSFESSELFDAELISEEDELIEQIVDDFWRIRFDDPLEAALGEYFNVSMETLKDFAEELNRKPLIKLLSASPNDMKKAREIFQELKTEWMKNSEKISSLLKNTEGFKAAYIKGLEESIRELDFSFSKRPEKNGLTAVEKFSTNMLAAGMKTKFQPPQHVFFETCEKFKNAIRGLDAAVKTDFKKYFESEYAQRKRRLNIQSYGDLLLNLRNALLSEKAAPLSNAVREKYKAALIDEFQDTDPVQYFIFNKIFNVPSHALFYIGDPKQAIYGFRGADIFSYMEAAASAPEKYTQDTNWRSESELVDAFNSMFGAIKNPFALGNEISYMPVVSAPESVGNKNKLFIEGNKASFIDFRFVQMKEGEKRISKESARQRIAEAVSEEIARLLNMAATEKAMLGEKTLCPSDIAVLATSHMEAGLMQQKLAEKNIPAVLQKSGQIFKTEEAEELRIFISAAAAPNDVSKINAALISNLAGFTVEGICAFNEDETKLGEYEKHINRFGNYFELWRDKGFFRMFRTFMADYSVRKNILTSANGERKLTNILQLAELTHRALSEKRLGINGAIEWLNEQMLSEEESEERELRLERDDKAVQILTVFKSKGLQYPIVFCPFMWQRKYSAARSSDFIFHEKNETLMDIGSGCREENRKKCEAENLSELMRLFYVAVTRAQNKCYLYWGKINDTADTALGYLANYGAEGNAKEQLNQLSVNIKDADEDALFEKLKHFEEISGGKFSLKNAESDSHGPSFRNAIDGTMRLAAKDFPKGDIIKKNWGIMSFSKITSGAEHEHAVHDMAKDDEESALSPDMSFNEAPSSSFLAFPSGTLTGECVHSIFEEIDFSAAPGEWKNVIAEKLDLFNLNEEGRIESVSEMLENVLKNPLGDSGFSLCETSNEERLAELEFYHPVKRLDSYSLRRIFGMNEKLSLSGFPEKTGRLEFKPNEGFMHGFIDLVFRKNGKYYLLDWKTNTLGASWEDYSQEKMRASMEDSFYILQYHIYVAALHKYLSTKIKNYDYAKDFGGVFYIYVRGVNPALPGNGVYFDLPDKELIKELCAL